MTALALFVKSPWLFLLALLVFGFLPIVVGALAARMYPPTDDRRREMAGELSAINVWQRPMWAAQELARGFTDGLPARRRARQEARTQQVLDRRFYDEQRREAELREVEQAEFEQVLVAARLLEAQSLELHVHVQRQVYARSRRHGAHARSHQRATLVPGVLMLTIGAALGGLALLPPAAAGVASPSQASHGFHWSVWGVSVAVAVALILAWVLIFVGRDALNRKPREQRTRPERHLAVRVTLTKQQP